MTKPETLYPILPSAGYGDRRPTRHDFSHYETVTVPYGGIGLAPMYTCSETGMIRRWGFEELPS